DTPTAYRRADEKGATLLAARTSRDPARGLVVERTDGGAPPASPAEPILGTDVTWLDVGIDFVNWRNPALAGEDRLKGRVCDLLDVEPAAPTPGCAKARLWVDRAQKVVMQAAQVDENGREVRKLWVRAVQKVDDHWIFKDLEVETAGTGHRTRLHFDNVSFPDSALSPAR
ncbi:MAG: outer membrane lipoprotein-sorting protein, partial [Kiritimatiellae bacterium]|nr:outer membrane lipoprotein-sorting protein [Kiritimatiellia bacterium]